MTQWGKYRQSIQDHLNTDSMDTFLEWSTIRATMYVGNGAAYIPGEYQTLKADWDKWGPVIKWTGFGSDAFHSGSGYTSDPNLIHQAYHLKQWLDRTRQKLEEMSTIIELGAGYGAMALICHRLGFNGQYHIIDLPELIQIQRYYLEQNGVAAQWDYSRESGDLFIASHSLGEIPLPERERLLSPVAAKEYLFASSYEYEGADNAGWFQQFARETTGLDWTFYPHPYQENAFYQVGVEL